MYQPENSDHIPYVKWIRTVLQFHVFCRGGKCFSRSVVRCSTHPMECVLKITHCTQLHICERHLAEATSGLFGEGKLFSGS